MEEENLEVRNPYDGSLIELVPVSGPAAVARALEGAANYGHSLAPHERYAILSRIAQGLEREADAFARLITCESGKTLGDSRCEVERASRTLIACAEEAKRIGGEVLPVDVTPGLKHKYAIVLRQPIGVIAAVTPFNFPLNSVAHKLGPAIASNNAIILKPSERTPLTALRLAELCLEAGLPKEMLHVVVGDPRRIVGALLQSPTVKMLTFTGSSMVGKALCHEAGLRRVSMELGGTNPLLVLDDADIDAAVACAAAGVFGNNGQRCTSIRRIIVDNEVADDFIERFLSKTVALKLGNPMDPSTDIGPLIDEAAAIRVTEAVNQAVSEGGKLLLGGGRHGTLVEPAILDRIHPTQEIVQEETFGPVACVIRAAHFEQAIEIANNTRYGLQAGVFTRNLDRALRAAERVVGGSIVINDGPGFRADHLPFGGVGDSGIGREGARFAIHEMTVGKSVII